MTASAKTILIVEDNELNMRLFNDILQASGYQTLQTGDGSEAVILAEEHRPDLILMDMRLPGISGMEATEIIKGRDDLRHIPIVAVTASALKGDEEKILAGGCDGFIAKPISIPTFLATIAQFLNE
ncbi:MAG: response regulator receiver protein [Rhodospirillales bacterium]|jgi:two-component system cell cycle response regulator DivK|nr:response regulator receiver protein [Rhodospirillales bacterium]